MLLRPFFSYYGGKYRAAPHYPAPKYPLIIEPFAGSAGYSVRHNVKQALLLDKNPIVAAVWRHLISTTPERVLSLPDVPLDGSVEHLPGLCQEERHLIGFWLNQATSHPSNKPSAWMRSGLHPYNFWGPRARARIARQVDSIRTWRVIEGDYLKAPDIEACWFIDPPYSCGVGTRGSADGDRYKHGSSKIDFAKLADWCRGRKGQVIVCEQAGASWLPFVPLGSFRATPTKQGEKRVSEVIWTNGTMQRSLF